MTATTADTPPPRIAHIDAVLADPATRQENAERGPFQATLGLIGKALGTARIGVNVTVVPPGKRAWPRHYHYGNDELFVILEGAATLLWGDDRHPLKAGDVVSAPAGEGVPFSIHNDTEDELRYLALSTLDQTDVIVYPDSGKVGYFAGCPPLREGVVAAERKVRFVPIDQALGYWQGEAES